MRESWKGEGEGVGVRAGGSGLMRYQEVISTFIGQNKWEIFWQPPPTPGKLFAFLSPTWWWGVEEGEGVKGRSAWKKDQNSGNGGRNSGLYPWSLWMYILWKEATAAMTALVYSGLHTRLYWGYVQVYWTACTQVHAEANRLGLHRAPIQCWYCIAVNNIKFYSSYPVVK